MKTVVVGGGVAGLGIGWRLAQHGADVVLIERSQPARAATWAAAGMISPTAEHDNASSPEVVFAQHAAALWPGFAGDIQECTGIEVGYRADGKLVVALTAKEEAALAAQAAGLQGQVEIMTPAQARALEPLLNPDLAAALWDRNEAQVDNRALGRALVAAFVLAGGHLQLNEAAVRFEHDGRRVVGVRTPFTLHEGDIFVLAAGAWSGQIEGLPADVAPPTLPVKGEMIALEPSAPRALPVRSIWGNGVYLVARAGRLLVGAAATREGFDTSLSKSARDFLVARAQALLPAVKGWPVTEHWAGLRPGSPDDLPILGRSALENLFIATGQFRNGILFAPAIADALGALIRGGDSGIDLTAFDPRRFAGPRPVKDHSPR